jgi:hypothetical protein
VVGRSPEQFFVNSPQRKSGSRKGKRSAPQAKPLNATAASFVLGSAAFHPGTASSKTLPRHSPCRYVEATRTGPGSSTGSGKKKGVRVDESKNKVVEVDLMDDDDEDWEDMASD